MKFKFECTWNPQTFIVPQTGVYLIECFGAQGGGQQTSGNSQNGVGGLGGYASGLIKLEQGLKLYVYVGCEGKNSNSGPAEGGFNGGGTSYASSSNEPASGGGGASDIRLIGGSWDNENGLLSRFIVAGGGGGGGEDSGDTGGYGGGTSGKTISSTGSAFGKGAHTVCDGGGGGGGWVGGGTNGGSQTIPTSGTGCDTSGGSGGSGYVYTNTSTVKTGYLVSSKYQMTSSILKENVRSGNGAVYIIPTFNIYLNNLSCKRRANQFNLSFCLLILLCR